MKRTQSLSFSCYLCTRYFICFTSVTLTSKSCRKVLQSARGNLRACKSEFTPKWTRMMDLSCSSLWNDGGLKGNGAIALTQFLKPIVMLNRPYRKQFLRSAFATNVKQKWVVTVSLSLHVCTRATWHNAAVWVGMSCSFKVPKSPIWSLLCSRDNKQKERKDLCSALLWPETGFILSELQD